jgi:protoheme IX farnesyltransferase
MPESAGAIPATLVGPVPRRAGSATWRDYLTLTKPRIMSLLVLTLACGGASALNHVLDRDIDRLMGPRTASRPVAAGRIAPWRAVAFGALLSALAFAILALFANPLSAGLAISGGAYYVLVYTLWLKRTTPQNIVIGGAAGAIPSLAGWAAADGRLGTIVLLWTPPHFWALALLLERHYAAASVPMLPVVSGARATARQVLLYCLVLLAATLLPVLTGTFGVAYLLAAIILGLAFCGLAARLWRRPTSARAALTFHYSLLYLALLFCAVAVDAVVR